MKGLVGGPLLVGGLGPGPPGPPLKSGPVYINANNVVPVTHWARPPRPAVPPPQQTAPWGQVGGGGHVESKRLGRGPRPCSTEGATGG